MLLERPGVNFVCQDVRPLVVAGPVPLSNGQNVHHCLHNFSTELTESELNEATFRWLLYFLLLLYISWCVCGYLVHAFPCTWKCTYVLRTFFCDYVCKPCSPPCLFLWFSGKFPDCRCAGLEHIEAVTKAPAVSLIIPCASPCTASPSKERWLLGTPLGTGLGDGKWAWQRRSRHASRKQECNQWCSTE